MQHSHLSQIENNIEQQRRKLKYAQSISVRMGKWTMFLQQTTTHLTDEVSCVGSQLAACSFLQFAEEDDGIKTVRTEE